MFWPSGKFGCLQGRKHSSNEQGHVEWEYTYIYIYILKRAPSLDRQVVAAFTLNRFSGAFLPNGSTFYASQPEIFSKASGIRLSSGIQS